jgi:hypothetical protein
MKKLAKVTLKELVILLKKGLQIGFKKVEAVNDRMSC